MTTIVWEGILYNSLEYFQLFEIEDTMLVKSRIIGTFQNDSFFVEYNLKIDKEWKIYSFEIATEVNTKKKKFSGIKLNNEWKINNTTDLRFNGYDFIDITLTPFTNSLPINNLQLAPGQEKEIAVMYFDILENNIKPVKQKYQRDTSTNFKFETVPNDFEAAIETDEHGLVTFYPALFKRITKIKSDP